MATPPQDDDDVALLRRVVAGDHRAFERLYWRYTPRLTPYLRTLLDSQALVEDVLHEVWLVVWQQAGRYQATGRVASWLFGIARHKAHKAHAQAARSRYPLSATQAQTAWRPAGAAWRRPRSCDPDACGCHRGVPYMERHLVVQRRHPGAFMHAIMCDTCG
jgi:DNA-directed RNA polymerase specialized sigma24 family protein